MFESIDVLEGKVLERIERRDTDDGDELWFYTTDGEVYKMFHAQDCCESVWIEDICGDSDDLIGAEILLAEEVTNEDEGPLNEWDESYTWTFYKLATDKGHVTIRWYGTSNGYYSESVDFIRVD